MSLRSLWLAGRIEITDTPSAPSAMNTTAITSGASLPTAMLRPSRAGTTIEPRKNSTVSSAKSIPCLARFTARLRSSQTMMIGFRIYEKCATSKFAAGLRGLVGRLAAAGRTLIEKLQDPTHQSEPSDCATSPSPPEPREPAMTAVLKPHLPFHDDETPLSWASRLAAFHTGGDVGAFLRDFGIDPRDLAAENSAAIHRLAALGGTDPARVARNAVERLEGDLARCRGETFDRRFVLRHRQLVCAQCLVDDTAGAAAPDPTHLCFRFSWQFTVVTACPIHAAPLMEIAAADGVGGGQGLSIDGDTWHAIRRAADAGDVRPPSPLQLYVLDRLDGAVGPSWLDGQRLDLAVDACAVLGAVALRGARPRVSRFSVEDRAEAHRLGFAIAGGGEPGIRRLFDQLQRDCPTDDGHAGPQAAFGLLHEWAARTARDRGPLAALLRRHIVETMPVGPGDVVLGEAVTTRRIHSVRTLAVALGLDARRLRKLLETRGLIAPEMRGLPDNRVVFDAAAGEAVAGALTQSVPRNALPACLGVGRGVAAGLLVGGLLTPAVTPDADRRLNGRRFLRADLDDLVARCLDGAAIVDEAPPGFDDLRRAASRAKTTVAALLCAVMDGRVRERVRLRGGHALGALRISSTAARAVLSPVLQSADYAPYRAAQRLKTTDRVVAALMADGPDGPILPSRLLPNNRSASARVIPHDALDAFERDYVSLINLARERGAHHVALAAALRDRGVTPAFNPAIVKATFFRRDAIPPDI